MFPARGLARFACRATTGAAARRVSVTRHGKRETVLFRKREAAAAVATDQRRVTWHA
jgi:hypothetical protein